MSLPSSNHTSHVHKSMPYGLALRLRGIIYDEETREKRRRLCSAVDTTMGMPRNSKTRQNVKKGWTSSLHLKQKGPMDTGLPSCAPGTYGYNLPSHQVPTFETHDNNSTTKGHTTCLLSNAVSSIECRAYVAIYYIGKTNRSFRDRITQHRHSIRCRPDWTRRYSAPFHSCWTQ